MSKLKKNTGVSYNLELSEDEATLLGKWASSNMHISPEIAKIFNGFPTSKDEIFVDVGMPAGVYYIKGANREAFLANSVYGKFAAPVAKKWTVQCKLKTSDMWFGYSGDNEFEFYSRNNAYRKMRLLEKTYPNYEFRVVPKGTKHGVEKDIGYYTIQYYDREKEEFNEFSPRKRYSKRIAQEKFDKYNKKFTNWTFRLKWHSGNN